MLYLNSWCVVLLILLPGCLSLSCYEGYSEKNGAMIDSFNSTTCEKYQDWCYQLHAPPRGAEDTAIDIKMCWDANWEQGRYQDEGCIIGEHCINGACYNGTTVCLCKSGDLCNNWTEGGNETTPIAYPPTYPPDGHSCWYSVKENNKTTGLEYTEQCYSGENMCVIVAKEDEGYEYRACFDADFDIEFQNPGCYKGFQHCHRGICHNDTELCVCAESMCNEEHFSSQAPPVTPGSGLYCYKGGWDEYEYTEVACTKDDNYCIEFTSVESNNTWADCFNPATYNKYNYTGCETTQSCWDGKCFNSTVCVCEDNLCNGFGIPGENQTTPVPVTMTTSNTTMHCWYGISHNGTTPDYWQREVCAPQEDRCILVTSGDFSMAHCYDTSYDNGSYISGTYLTGEHCWRGECHNGTVYVCTEPMCNDQGASTPAPHETTPGSGLECLYGVLSDHSHDHDHPDKNLTTQICDKKETLCLAVYGDEDDFFMGSCWDPAGEDGKYNVSDVCIQGLHCWHDDDGSQDCHNGTVCTCNTNNCNSRNVSSTLPTETTPTPNPSTMSCWFGEKHPYTGEEDWKKEVCESTEHFCFQLVHGEGDQRTEVRECWDLAYEEGRFTGSGCYKGPYCHHEHCFNDTSVCICETPYCNDWGTNPNRTTVEPVTPGSGLLCYSGDEDNNKVKPCASDQPMCMAYTVTGRPTTFDCYSPKSNDGLFVTSGCWDGVQIEQSHQPSNGRLCLCDDDNLCNGKFVEHGGGGAGQLVISGALLLALLGALTVV